VDLLHEIRQRLGHLDTECFQLGYQLPVQLLQVVAVRSCQGRLARDGPHCHATDAIDLGQNIFERQLECVSKEVQARHRHRLQPIVADRVIDERARSQDIAFNILWNIEVEGVAADTSATSLSIVVPQGVALSKKVEEVPLHVARLWQVSSMRS
jgi:hypothetical protein